MREPVIAHADIRSFAEDRVNLPSESVRKHRKQVNNLRERLEAHIETNDGFALVKMLHAGSVAKGTALRSVNDLDVAVYVKREETPVEESELVSWIAERLLEANPNMSSDQFDDTSPHCVKVSFRGSGLDVDVVPVLYEGEENDIGYLVAQDTGQKLLTSIPLHLEFIRNRKKAHPTHFAQVVRLTKWWASQRKAENADFKCKSFLLELLVAYLADKGIVELTDYPAALEAFFSWIVKTGLEERISFSDYYSSSHLPIFSGTAIEVFDPVSSENNITERYTLADRKALVEAAEEAADALREAHYAMTKARAVTSWQVVLGSSFRG